VLLYTSNAIAYHVANDALRGTSSTDVAYVQQWMEFADSEILPAALTWVFPCMGVMQYNKQVTLLECLGLVEENGQMVFHIL